MAYSSSSSSSSSDFFMARCSLTTRANEVTLSDSTAFSTNAKNEKKRAADENQELDSEGKPLNKSRLTGNPAKSGGSRLLLSEEMLQVDQERGKNCVPRILDISTVAMTGRETEKEWRNHSERERGGKMVAAAPVRRKRGREDDCCCPQCGCTRITRRVSETLSPQYGCSERTRTAASKSLSVPSLPPPTSSSSALLSTATSPITYNLTTFDIPDKLSDVFCKLRYSISSTTASSPPTFTLEVFAQEVPLPSPMPDPTLTLHVCLLDTHIDLYPGPSGADNALPIAAPPEREESKVCHKWEAADARCQSSVHRLLCLETALSDVQQLLTLLAYHSFSFGCCSQDSPWVLMPINLLAVDAVAKIQRYLHHCQQFRLLKMNRIICHLHVTAHHGEYERSNKDS